VLLPGLYWDWQLHPYQYIYYNSLVGGVAGASSNYEMDYWGLSYKEGIEYINQVAPKNATVSFWGIYYLFSSYARHDLKIKWFSDPKDPGYAFNTVTDYAIISTQLNSDQVYFPDSKVIYRVQRAGAVLTVVKQVNKGDLIMRK
jgi:hypothetical protein